MSVPGGVEAELAAVIAATREGAAPPAPAGGSGTQPRRTSDKDGLSCTGRSWTRDRLQELRIAAELDVTGAVASRFVYGTRVNVPDYMIKDPDTASKVYRLVSDHVGSVRVVVDVADGTWVQRMNYDEFGRVLEQTCPSLSADECKYLHPFGFAGGLYDPDTGLVRFGARDYDDDGRAVDGQGSDPVPRRRCESLRVRTG